MTRVSVVRPYGRQIRERVFALLDRAGLSPREEDVIPKGTDDEQVVATLRRQRPDVLVIPFHAHRDGRGETVNGLDLIERLLEEAPELSSLPILMPASMTALPAAHLRLSPLAPRPLPERVRSRILLIDESDLDAPGLADAIRDHVSGR